MNHLNYDIYLLFGLEQNVVNKAWHHVDLSRLFYVTLNMNVCVVLAKGLLKNVMSPQTIKKCETSHYIKFRFICL